MKVLVVEDYEPLISSLTEGLRLSGFAVDASRDGEEGLWYARGNEYDTIVLDIMLPKLDGLQVLDRLRQEGNDTPILLLTARTAVEDRVLGLDKGADDYLTKPFAFEELLSRVRALIRRRYGRLASCLEVGDLVLDTARKTARRGDRSISLTPREYALIEYLASRPGEVVSRTEIWEHIYEFHSEATSNVVDVYISFLRKKIDLGSDKPLIHTRRGLGYVLEERD